jgi:hypothetical protein
MFGEQSEMGGAYSAYGRWKGFYRMLVGNPEKKKQHGRHRRILENNIKWNLRSGMCAMDWIELAQDRNRWRVLLNVVMNLRVL